MPKPFVRIESVTEPPNYFVRTLGIADDAQALRPITRFPNPFPQFAAVKKELITYRRADGVALSGTLYLPPNRDLFVEALPTLLWAYPREYKDADAAGQIRQLEAALAAIDATLTARLPLLGTALGLPIADNELTASLDPKLRKASLEALLVECVRARAAAHPLLFVLEDCHWIDPLSHELLETLGRAVADLPVAFVVAYRPPEVERLQTPRVTTLPQMLLVF